MTTSMLGIRRGTTLLELVVVIALLGLISTVVAQSGLATSRRSPGAGSALDSLRRLAIRAGRSQHAVLRDSAGLAEVTALPSGEVLADSTMAVGTSSVEQAR